MDLDLKEDGSDSDISDSWTLLNCSEEDVASHENGRDGTSDAESLESDGIEKRGLSSRDEESDGISVISESDICDNTEAIPGLESNISSQPLVNDIRPLPSFPRKRICHDSFSESDGCEVADVTSDSSICPKNGKKSRNDRPVSINELDSCDYVEELRAEPNMQPKDKQSMRIYVHRPNDQINFILTILLALALAAVAGLGTGHFLGTQEVMMTPEETIYKLQLENQILHSQLQVLLKERKEFGRNMEVIDFSGGKNVNRPGQFHSECSKIMNNYLYFQSLNAFLNRSLINSNVPVFVKANSMEKAVDERLGFGNLKNMFNDQAPPPSEEIKKRNANLGSGNVDYVLEIAPDSIITEANPKQSSEEKISRVNKGCSDKTYQENETTKLMIEMKSALTHGLALSNKLKEAISYLDAAFTNWKKSGGAVIDTNTKSVEKKNLKEFKHILHDGGKAKKILSKTVDKLDSIKRNIFKSCSGQNFWDDLIFKKNNHDSGPNLGSDIGHESFSDMCTSKQNNLTPVKSHSSSSGVIYGPHLPVSVSTSYLCHNIQSNSVCMKDASDSIVELKPLVSKDIMEDCDMVTVDVEDEDTLPIDNVNFKLLPLEGNQILAKQLLDDFQNNPKSGEISSEKDFKSTGEVRSKRDLNYIELSHPRQIPLESNIRKINHKSKQKEYSSKQSNKHFDQKSSYKNHFKINSEEENHESEKNPKKHASILQHKSSQIRPEQIAEKDSDKKSVKINEEDFKNSRKIKSEENSNKAPPKPSREFKEDYKIKLEDSPRSKNKKDYENEKKRKNQEHKFSSKERKNEKYEKEIKSEKKFKQRHEPKSKGYEFRPKDKLIHKKNNHESDKYNRKLHSDHHKHRDAFKKDIYVHKALVQEKKIYTKHPKRIAWFVDDHGHKFTNLTGDWLLKMNQARAKERERTRKGDWFFDRAISRRIKREEDMERGRWYFQRARSREICRLEPHSDWCKNQEKNSKFERSDAWKRDQQFSDHDEDHDHYRKDRKTKRSARPWRGTRFISNAFKAAMNLMKA